VPPLIKRCTDPYNVGIGLDPVPVSQATCAKTVATSVPVAELRQLLDAALTQDDP